MKSRSILALMFFVLVGTFSSTGVLAQEPSPAEPVSPQWWAMTTAYQVAYTFRDPWYEPHFGAWFDNVSCTNPRHYLGPGGDQATCEYGCIWNWDWWTPDGGAPPVVTLVPKSFLDANWDRWQGSNYQATCWFD